MSESAGLAHYDALVHRIYDAANDTARWPAVMSGIAEVCDSRRCLLLWPGHAPLGGPSVLPGERVATACCRDAQRPAVRLSVLRGEGDAPFEPAVLALLDRLVGHVARALGMGVQPQAGQWQWASTRAVLDQMAAGALLLDAEGGLAFVNAAAHRLLGRGDPIGLTSAASEARLTLAGRLQPFQADFQRAMREALSPSAKADATSHGTRTFVLPDAADKPAWVLHLAPLSEERPLALSSPSSPPPLRAVVFLHDLGAATSVAPTLLNELFDLTPAEARAAVQVLRGGTAEEMAGRLGVAVCTFKSQLQLVYVSHPM